MNKGEEIPKVPKSVNADLMTDEELREKLQKGYDDYKAGKVQDAKTAFDEFRKKHEGDVQKLVDEVRYGS